MARKHTPIAKQLIAAIRKAERQGITRYRIAKAAGVHQSQLSRLLAGEKRPRLDTAERIAEALGCEVRLVPKKDS